MYFNNFRNIARKKNENNLEDNYKLQVPKDDIKLEFMENKTNNKIENKYDINKTNDKIEDNYNINNMNLNKEEDNILRNYDNIPPLRAKQHLNENMINNIYNKKDINLNIEENMKVRENIKEEYIYKDNLNSTDKYNLSNIDKYNYIENNKCSCSEKNNNSSYNNFLGYNNKDKNNTLYYNNADKYNNIQYNKMYYNNAEKQNNNMYNNNYKEQYYNQYQNNNYKEQYYNQYQNNYNNQYGNLYQNYIDNNLKLSNSTEKRPESLINKFPTMTDKLYYNDYNKKEFNDKHIISMLENIIINKYRKINYYNNLISKVREEEKVVLNEIRLDKQKHEKLLLEIYKMINRNNKESFINYKKEENIIISENLKEEYKKCISKELSSVELFKRLYFIVENNKVKNLLYEIIIDTLCHSLKLNYCILNHS